MTNSFKMKFGRYDYAAFVSFFAYAAGSVVVPVALVSLSRELGFSLDSGGMTASGALHMGRTVSMVLAMLICGFASAHFGKRRTLGVSVALMGVGILLCSVAPLYGILFAALLIAGLGEGVIEGLATPFVQDLHPKEPGRYINFTHSFWSIGVLVTVLTTGAVLSLGVSWRSVTAVVAVFAFIAAGLILWRESEQHKFPEHPEQISPSKVWQLAQKILKTNRFWIFFAAMFLAGGGEFCLTFWTASFIQLNFINAAWAGGVGTAFFAAGMVLGRTGWGYLIKQHQLKGLILWSALAGTITTLLLPMVQGLWSLFGILFLSGIATAPFWPSIQSYCTDRLPDLDTTLVFIILSCAGVPGCGVFTLLMGYIGDQAGLRVAFYLVPACFLVLGSLIAIESMRGTPDVISSGENGGS